MTFYEAELTLERTRIFDSGAPHEHLEALINVRGPLGEDCW